MAQYSFIEKKIAKFLESQPWLRDLIKLFYKRFVYLFSQKRYKIKLHNDYSLIDVSRYCNLDAYDAVFFGYYDKTPWSVSNSRLVAHLLRDNRCYIVLFDLESRTHKILTETRAWNYQQGAMLHWLDNDHILFNDYENDLIVVRKFSIISCEIIDTIPFPIQVLHPGKLEYLSLNYRRLSWLRPDYGYFSESSNFQVKQSYENDGIWKIDLLTHQYQLIVKLSDLIAMVDDEFKSAKHKVNHCYYSPDGAHFVFLHRWLNANGKFSRLMCADSDGYNLKILLDFRMISHYSWLDNHRLVIWARTPEYGDSYIVYDISKMSYERLDSGNLSKFGDGHPTSCNENGLIVTDTYPNKGRMRTLMSYNKDSKKVIEIGDFYSPWKFEDEKRCDLHPRWNSNGDRISIDSAHEGKRKTYMILLNK